MSQAKRTRAAACAAFVLAVAGPFGVRAGEEAQSGQGPGVDFLGVPPAPAPEPLPGHESPLIEVNPAVSWGDVLGESGPPAALGTSAPNPEVLSSTSPVWDVGIENCAVLSSPVTPGSEVSLSVEVANLGDQPVQGVPLDLIFEQIPAAPTQYVTLQPGERTTLVYDFPVPSYDPGPNALCPVYFLLFSLGALESEQRTENNHFWVALGLQRGEDVPAPSHDQDPPVHQWISLQVLFKPGPGG